MEIYDLEVGKEYYFVDISVSNYKKFTFNRLEKIGSMFRLLITVVKTNTDGFLFCAGDRDIPSIKSTRYVLPLTSVQFIAADKTAIKDTLKYYYKYALVNNDFSDKEKFGTLYKDSLKTMKRCLLRI